MSSRISHVTFAKFNRLALAIAAASASIGAIAAPGADSAYMTDPQFSFVEDATSKGIGQVNMITCFISSMAPDKLVNEGNYIALVDQAKCDSEKRSSSSNSASTNSGAQSSDYMTAIVNSSRASNDEPMVAKIWVAEEMEGAGAATIYVRAEATEAPSDTNAYGAFRMDFCGRGDGEIAFGFGCMMKGYLQASSSGITFYQEEGGGMGDHSSTTALQMTATSASAGSGRLYQLHSGGDGTSEEEFSFAYNNTHFLRGDQCFSRDATEADMSVWRYGVYNADTGARVELNSGFPIEYTPTGSATTYHGYLGYYGLNLPGEAMTALAQEENPQVQRVEYQNNAEPVRTAYTVVQNGGKLMKYSKQTRTLAGIDKVKFSVFVNDSASEFFAGAQEFSQYEAYWDETSGHIKVTGSFQCNQNGCQTQNFDIEQTGNLAYFATRGGLRGWSQSLGGDLFINLVGAGDTVDSSAIEVVYRTQNLVYPSDMPATLHCVSDCPTADSISAYLNQTQMSPVQSPMQLASNYMPTAADSVVNYTTSNGVLIDANSASVTMTDADALQMFPQYSQGIRSGRLVTDVASIACDDPAGSYCDFKAFDLTDYYVWETGPNSWNQFAAVKDANGDFVEFDAPQQFSYTVPQGTRYGAFAGQNIVLEYGGFGELHGIPGHCVSHVTNETVSCDGNHEETRYVPAFAIPGNATITHNNTTYLVKWLDREIRFARKDAADCAALSVPGVNDITLPTNAGLDDPSDPTNTAHYIGTKPVIDAAPRVIQGEVMY